MDGLLHRIARKKYKKYSVNYEKRPKLILRKNNLSS